jgi:hypothetical protein
MNRRRFVLLAGALLAAGVVSAAGQAKPEPFRLTSAVTMPFDLVTRHIMLPATINGSRPLTFVLDTGANSVIVDFGRAADLGLTLSGQVRVGGVGEETMTGAFVKDASLVVPGLTGFTRPVTLAIAGAHSQTVWPRGRWHHRNEFHQGVRRRDRLQRGCDPAA